MSPLYLFASGNHPEAVIRGYIEELEKKHQDSPDDLDIRYELAAVHFELAVRGEESSLDRASELFKNIYESDPTRYDARAFYGSATVLRAKYATIFKKKQWARKGFMIIDEAYANAPDDLAVRLIRASNAAEVPNFLKRSAVARADFDWLLNRYEENPHDFAPAFRRVFYILTGKFLLEDGDSRALDLLTKAEELPGSEHLEPQRLAALAEARERLE